MNQQTGWRVRPRRVWVGLAIALLGACVLVVGVAIGSWVVGLVGLVVLGIGGGAGAAGGGRPETHGTHSLNAQIEEVADDRTDLDAAPGNMLDDDVARAKAVRLSERRRALVGATEHGPRPPLALIGAIVLMIIAIVLWTAEWSLYPTGSTSQANADRSLGVAIIVAAAGLRHLVSVGRHLVISTAAGAAGVGLVVAAFLADHEVESTRILEAACGVLVILAAVTCVASPRLGEERSEGIARSH